MEGWKNNFLKNAKGRKDLFVKNAYTWDGRVEKICLELDFCLFKIRAFKNMKYCDI